MSCSRRTLDRDDDHASQIRHLDLASIAACALIWGTTFFAITLQFGAVDPLVSVFYRFALAAIVLFGWLGLRRESIGLDGRQHLAALGIGVTNFAANYPLVYFAEERLTSAVVAVAFASMAFTNLVAFRLVFGQRASARAWSGAIAASLAWRFCLGMKS